MANIFDDIIPSKSSGSASSGNIFDDIIPEPKPDLATKAVEAIKNIAQEGGKQLQDLTTMPARLLNTPHPPMVSNLATKTIPKVTSDVVEGVTKPLVDLEMPVLTPRNIKPLLKGDFKNLETTPVSPSALDLAIVAGIPAYQGGRSVLSRVGWNKTMNDAIQVEKIKGAIMENIGPLENIMAQADMKLPANLPLEDKVSVIISQAQKSPTLGDVLVKLSKGKLEPLAPVNRGRVMDIQAEPGFASPEPPKAQTALKTAVPGDLALPEPIIPQKTAIPPIESPTAPIAPVGVIPGAEIITDPARVQEVKNSITEGELILKSGTINGRKMSAEELENIKRSVDNAKTKIGITKKPSIVPTEIKAEEKVNPDISNKEEVINAMKPEEKAKYDSLVKIASGTKGRSIYAAQEITKMEKAVEKRINKQVKVKAPDSISKEKNQTFEGFKSLEQERAEPGYVGDEQYRANIETNLKQYEGIENKTPEDLKYIEAANLKLIELNQGQREKQPWQMTQAEWDKTREDIKPNIAQSNFTKSSGSKAVARIKELTNLTYGVNNAAKEKISLAQRGDIKLTQEEADNLLEQLNTPVSHKQVIEKALSEGKPVPPEVLADYPELQEHSAISAEELLKNQIGDIFKKVEPTGSLWKSKNNIIFIKLLKNRPGFTNWLREKNFIKKVDEAGNNIYRVEIKSQLTQKEAVKQSVAEGPKTIKSVAEETGILEPNVRRILGVGAKEGTFSRVDKGVYILNKEGKDIAYVHTGDALEVLPKLAAEGLKADMIFLDIPYKTPAVTGGNRGVKYNLITTAQFSSVLSSLKKIVRDENTPILYMYSQAKSGLAEMAKYNNMLLAHGFKPVARGEYTKLQLDGVTRVRNMRGDIIEPEGILLLTQSGKFNKDNPDLNFKLIRPKGYQTEKPEAMLKKLIEMTTKEGEVVLDPFAGSGVTGAEAIKSGREAVLIEKNPEVVEKIIKPRLEEAAKTKREYSETKFSDEDKTILESIKKDIEFAQPGKKWVNNDMEEGFIGAGYEPSDFEYIPYWPKGWSKKPILSIIDKISKGVKLTLKQNENIQFLLNAYKEIANEEDKLKEEGIRGSEINEAKRIGEEEVIRAFEVVRNEVKDMSTQDLEKLIDSKYESGAPQEELDLLETLYESRVSEGEASIEEAEGAGLEEQLVKMYHRYLNPDQRNGMEVKDIVSNMRSAIETYGHGSPLVELNDDQILDTAKDLYDRKESLLGRQRNKDKELFPGAKLTLDKLYEEYYKEYIDKKYSVPEAKRRAKAKLEALSKIKTHNESTEKQEVIQGGAKGFGTQEKGQGELFNNQPVLDEYRKSTLPDYNTNKIIISLDAFVDKIKELDPKKDDIDYKHGYRYEAKVSYPESLGENGNYAEFLYKSKPTIAELQSDILQEYKDFKKEVNKEVAMGIVAKSGRDESIEVAIDKVLEEYGSGKKPKTYPKSSSQSAAFPEPIGESQDKAYMSDYTPQDHTTAVEMPELVKLAKELTGNAPIVAKLRGALGRFYGNSAGQANIKIRLDLFKNPFLAGQVLTHEIGHLVDWLPDYTLSRGNLIGRLLTLRKFMQGTFGDLSNKEIKEELKAATIYWHPFNPDKAPKDYVKIRFSSKELYAESISMLLIQPEKLKEIAPTFYKALWDNIDEKPEVKDALLGLQDFLNLGDAEKYKVRSEDLSKSFQDGESLFYAARNKYKLAQRSWFYKFKIQFIDKITPVIDKVKEAEKKGVKINPEDNPKYYLEDYNYIGGKIKNLLEEIHNEVIKPIEDQANTLEEFGKYLFLNRVITERADIANPLGHNRDTALKQLKYMEESLGKESFDNLKSAAGRFNLVMKRLLTEAEQSGLIKPDTFAEIITNPAYATFQVLDHLEDYVSSGIISQKGTLKNIANPFVSTVLKMISTRRAIERNNTNRAVVKFMQDTFPAEVEPAKIRRFGKYKAEVVERENFGIIKVREEGKFKAYYVDPYIADSVNYTPTPTANAVVQVLSWLNKGWFRPVYVNLNLGFQTYNFLRDFKRAWKLNPHTSFPAMIMKYKEAAPIAYRRVWGDMTDPVIKEMQENGMLSVTYNDITKGIEEQDESMAEYLLQQYGVLEKTQSLNPFTKLIKMIEDLGNFIETLPKVTGYLSRKNTGRPIKEVAHEVRVYSGSPDFLRKGKDYYSYNNIFLFSNAIKEGFRGDIEGAFKNPRTKGGFWWKTVVTSMLPKILMWLAAAGLFGEAIAKNYRKQSEYDKTNYFTIPMGFTESGKAIYFRMPDDETGKLLSGLLWKSLNMGKGGKLSDVINIAGGQIPSISPSVEVPVAWTTFFMGGNPYDLQKGNTILTRDEKTAGGVFALEPMFSWTVSKLGGGSFLSTFSNNKTVGEKVLSITPVLGRFIRISDYGDIEARIQERQQNYQTRSQHRLERRR